MTGSSIFPDSNIPVYLLEQDQKRRELVTSYIGKDYIISTQVVSENVNVCMKKLKMAKETAFNHGSFLMEAFALSYITDETIKQAFSISLKYGLSYWDSLIVSSAIENNCAKVYSEDMQHGQLIEKVRVINPFTEAGI